MKTAELVNVVTNGQGFDGAGNIPVKLIWKNHPSSKDILGMGLAWLSYNGGRLVLMEEFNGEYNREGRFTGDLMKKEKGSWNGFQSFCNDTITEEGFAPGGSFVFQIIPLVEWKG